MNFVISKYSCNSWICVLRNESFVYCTYSCFWTVVAVVITAILSYYFVNTISNSHRPVQVTSNNPIQVNCNEIKFHRNQHFNLIHPLLFSEISAEDDSLMAIKMKFPDSSMMKKLPEEFRMFLFISEEWILLPGLELIRKKSIFSPACSRFQWWSVFWCRRIVILGSWIKVSLQRVSKRSVQPKCSAITRRTFLSHPDSAWKYGFQIW